MITVQKLSQEHIEQVAALDKLMFSSPWSNRCLEKELKKSHSLWLVAVEEDTVAGYIGSQRAGDEADMMNLAVRLDYQGKGVGKMLVEALEQEMKAVGVRCLTLDVRESNLIAIGLYQKFGFQQAGRRKGYYRNPREDGLVLRKEWEL